MSFSSNNNRAADSIEKWNRACKDYERVYKNRKTLDKQLMNTLMSRTAQNSIESIILLFQPSKIKGLLEDHHVEYLMRAFYKMAELGHPKNALNLEMQKLIDVLGKYEKGFNKTERALYLQAREFITTKLTLELPEAPEAPEAASQKRKKITLQDLIVEELDDEEEPIKVQKKEEPKPVEPHVVLKTTVDVDPETGRLKRPPYCTFIFAHTPEERALKAQWKDYVEKRAEASAAVVPAMDRMSRHYEVEPEQKKSERSLLCYATTMERLMSVVKSHEQIVRIEFFKTDELEKYKQGPEEVATIIEYRPHHMHQIADCSKQRNEFNDAIERYETAVIISSLTKPEVRDIYISLAECHLACRKKNYENAIDCLKQAYFANLDLLAVPASPEVNKYRCQMSKIILVKLLAAIDLYCMQLCNMNEKKNHDEVWKFNKKHFKDMLWRDPKFNPVELLQEDFAFAHPDMPRVNNTFALQAGARVIMETFTRNQLDEFIHAIKAEAVKITELKTKSREERRKEFLEKMSAENKMKPQA